MIVVSILVPGIWSATIALWGPDRLVVQAILHLAAFLVLFVLAMLSMALVLKRDRSNAEQFVSRELDVVSGEVRTLREQHGDLKEQHRGSIEDLQRQIDGQDEVFRSAFEELGVVLPGRRISVRAKPIAFSVMVSDATVNVRGGSKWARFLRLFRRFGRWLKETVVGKPDHH